MSGVVGEINGWQCRGKGGLGTVADGCGGITYCIHVDDGVTPMFLACRATGTERDPCPGVGVSLMYPGAPYPRHVLEAVEWEWYAPRGPELNRLKKKARRSARHAAILEHVEKGGLELRKLTDIGRDLLRNADPAH